MAQNQKYDVLCCNYISYFLNTMNHLGEAPTVTISKDLIVFNGTDVQLTCTANGSPTPNITWFKRNTKNLLSD